MHALHPFPFKMSRGSLVLFRPDGCTRWPSEWTSPRADWSTRGFRALFHSFCLHYVKPGLLERSPRRLSSWKAAFVQDNRSKAFFCSAEPSQPSFLFRRVLVSTGATDVVDSWAGARTSPPPTLLSPAQLRLVNRWLLTVRPCPSLWRCSFGRWSGGC